MIMIMVNWFKIFKKLFKFLDLLNTIYSYILGNGTVILQSITTVISFITDFSKIILLIISKQVMMQLQD